jgi:hypothetical protein
MGEITTRELTIDGQMVTRVVPTYTCGHCSQVVVMRPDRVRERKRCSVCKRLICETNELCRVDCTPIHQLARDHFEADPKWTRLLPAIMAGCQSEAEARQRGLL